MSAEKQHKGKGAAGADPYHIPEDNLWANLWKVVAVVAVIGLAATFFGYTLDARRFFFSWLYAFMAVLTLGLGAIFFVVVQHLTVAGWSVTVRRTAETFAAGVPVFALLFLPLLLPGGLTHLYEWEAHGHGGEHAQVESGESLVGASVAQAQDHGHDHGEEADAHGSGHDDPQHALHAELLDHKAGYLNVPFWGLRALIYFGLWILIALFYFRSSVKQDTTKDPKLTVKMQKWAPLSMMAFGFTITFAGFDWMMSMEPTWYSTIYGVYIFAGAVVSIHALVTVVTMGLRAKGLLGNSVNTEHLHELGKMTFGFIVFWAYIGFSQMMLQWYANIPEEIIYYQYRWHGEGWRGVSWFLVFGHFALPFLFMISRVIKRRLALLAVGSVWMLLMHVVDLYWFVMPNFDRVLGFSPHWLDLTSILAVGGVYFAVVFWLMRRQALIPLGDPRLDRALHHQVV